MPVTPSKYAIALPASVGDTAILPDFSDTAYTITDNYPNNRVTRAGNVRVTRAGNIRVTRGYVAYTLKAQVVVAELPAHVAPVEVE